MLLDLSRSSRADFEPSQRISMFATIRCPHCAEPLGLPPNSTPSARLACPLCGEDFFAALAQPYAAPAAIVLDGRDDEDPHAEPSEPISAIAAVQQTADDPAVADVHEVAATVSGKSRLDQLLAELGATETRRAATPALGDENGSSPPWSKLDLNSKAEAPETDDALATPSDPLPAHANAQDDQEFVAGDDEAADSFDQHSPDDAVAWEIPAEITTSHRSAASTRRSPVPLLVGAVTSGVVGILLGGYGLLWFRGPAGDVFHLGQWLPDAFLPRSMRTAANDRPDVNSSSESIALPKDNSFDVADALPAFDGARFDPAVQQAAAQEPAPSPRSLADQLRAQGPVAIDFDSALVAVRSSLPKLLSGALNEPDAVREMGRSYVALCDLAQAWTLTPREFAGAGPTVSERAAIELFAQVANPRRATDVNTIAFRWLQLSPRQSHGVFFTGEVIDVRPRNLWSENLIRFDAGAAGSREVSVLTDDAKYGKGDRVAIAGVIVDDPTAALPDYDGAADVVIVAGPQLPVALPQN
jgi:hypothetical protein